VAKTKNPSFASILVTQGNYRFYIAALPSEILSKTCFVVSRDEDPVEGFQRRLNPARAEKIANYIDMGVGSIPTAIIVSAQADANLTYNSRSKTITFEELPTSFLIIDGQHRVFGFTKAKTSVRVPVVIYEGLAKKEEARLFVDINTTQEQIPEALLVDVKRLLENETEEERICSELFDKFFAEVGSILNGKLDRIGRSKGMISRVTFNQAVTGLLGIDILHSREIDEKYKIINNYLLGFQRSFSEISKDLDKVVFRPTVFQAILSANVYRIVVEKTISMHKGKFTPDSIHDVLKVLKSNLPANRLSRPGNSVKKLEDSLLEALTKIVSNPPLILE